ncbi:MAG: hypothetical protein WCT52_06125 [Candidatus Micrarchaeia archaeon]|jgi:hypothetical protein
MESSRHSRAFFSIDASFAFLTAVFIFVAFSAALISSALTAQSQSSEIASENRALRFSSYVLERTAVSGGGQFDGHYMANEIDAGKFLSFDLPSAMGRMNASFASIKLAISSGGELAPPASGSPSPKGTYCVERLAVFEGQAARLEACIS